MLTKEEIEKIKRGLTEELGRTITANECGLSTNDFSESIEILESALKYIEQLETREQNLIEKLLKNKKESMEELKYNVTKREARMQLQLVDNYLKILKGEKDE